MSQERRSIGVMVDWLEDEYQNHVFSGIESAAREVDVNVVCLCGGLLEAPYRFGQERNFIYDLVQRSSLGGLIVLSGAIANHVGLERLLAHLHKFEPLPMCSVGVRLPKIPGILVDNAKGVREMVSRLITLRGARRIAFIRGPSLNEEAELRFQAYRTELKYHGLEYDPELVVAGHFQYGSGADAVRVLLEERGQFPDALLAANDYMALGAMEALLARGLKVPEQMAVCGFDDVDDALFASVPLSTVRQPLVEQGRAALHNVLAQATGESYAREVVLDTLVIARESCGTSQYQMPRSSHGPASRSLSVVLEERSPALVRDMDEAIRMRSGSYSFGCSKRLLTAFLDELNQIDRGGFLRSLQAVLDDIAGRGVTVSSLQAALSVLREFVLPHVQQSSAEFSRAECLIHAARAMVSDRAEYEEAQKRLRQAQQFQALRRFGEELSTTMTETDVMAVAQQRLSSVGIPSAYVVLYHTAPTGERQARLAVVDVPAGSERPQVGDGRPSMFDPDIVLSHQLLPRDRRFSFVVQPLFSKNEQLGVLLLEVAPSPGVVYEFLRAQISNALKAAALVKQVVDETARRQAAEKEHVLRELELAARIQTTILPRPTEVSGLDIAATMIPATQVGGDYYDILPFPGGCWLGIGDVAGHGLGTGLVMLMVQSIVASLCTHSPGAKPSTLLSSVNRVLYSNVRERLEQDEHATLALIRYTEDGQLTLAGGHEDMIVCRTDGTCEVVPSPGPWVGAFDDIDASNVDQVCQLRHGDLIVLYTDGVTEALNASQEHFGLERLVAEVRNVRHRSVAHVRDHLLESVRRWLASQQDDITLLVARYQHPSIAE